MKFIGTRDCKARTAAAEQNDYDTELAKGQAIRARTNTFDLVNEVKQNGL